MYLDNGLKKNFTIIPNELICDDSLSGEARALFCYLASRPESWQFLVPEIQKHFKKPIQKPLKELEQARWLVRTRKPIKGKGMGFEWVWFVSATKFTNEQIQEIAQQSASSNYPPKITTIVETSEYTKTENKLTKTECINNPIVPRGTCMFPAPDGSDCDQENPQPENQNNFFLGSASDNEPKQMMGDSTNNNFVDSKFEEMWSAYVPYATREGRSVNKGAKKVAREKFIKAVSKGANPDDIIKGTKRYIADCHSHKCLTKNVPTFLNQEQWKDYLTTQNFVNTHPIDLDNLKPFEDSAQFFLWMKPIYNEWFESNSYLKNKITAIKNEIYKPVYWGQEQIVLKMAQDLAKEIWEYRDTPEIKNSLLDPNLWSLCRFKIEPATQSSALMLIGYCLREMWLGAKRVNSDK